MKLILKNAIHVNKEKTMKTAKFFDEVSFDEGLKIKSLLETQNSKEIKIIIPKDKKMKL